MEVSRVMTAFREGLSKKAHQLPLVTMPTRQRHSPWYEEEPVPWEDLPIQLKRWRRLALRCMVHIARGALSIVCSQWHSVSVDLRLQECTHPPECHRNHSNAYAHQLICEIKKGGCGAIINYIHTPEAVSRRAHAKSKARQRAQAKPISVRAEQIAEYDEDSFCPRCGRTFHSFQTQSGQTILRCDGWKTQTNTCTFIKARVGEILRVGDVGYVDLPAASSRTGPAPSTGPTSSTAESVDSHTSLFDALSIESMSIIEEQDPMGR